MKKINHIISLSLMLPVALALLSGCGGRRTDDRKAEAEADEHILKAINNKKN